MTDTAETATAGILLSKPELTFTKLALERLAADYEQQGEEAALARTRALLQRLTNYAEGKPGMEAARSTAFQKAFMEASGQGPEAANRVLVEWWEALLQEEPHPASKLALMLVPMMSAAGNQTALGVIHGVGTKLEALEGRHGESTAITELGTWLTLGLEQAREGRQLWADDPDMVRSS